MVELVKISNFDSVVNFGIGVLLTILAISILILIFSVYNNRKKRKITLEDFLVHLVPIVFLILAGLSFKDYIKIKNNNYESIIMHAPLKTEFDNLSNELGTIDTAKRRLIFDLFKIDFSGKVLGFDKKYKSFLLEKYEEYLKLNGNDKEIAYNMIVAYNESVYNKYKNYVDNKVQKDLDFSFKHISEDYKKGSIIPEAVGHTPFEEREYLDMNKVIVVLPK